jgi:tRNA A37 methylthiotransferase MiaB
MQGEVNGALAKARLKELTSIVDANNLAFRKAFEHLPLEVLIESEKEGRYHGLDQFFNKVVIESQQDLVGNWLNVEKYRVEEDANYVRF